MLKEMPLIDPTMFKTDSIEEVVMPTTAINKYIITVHNKNCL